MTFARREYLRTTISPPRTRSAAYAVTIGGDDDPRHAVMERLAGVCDHLSVSLKAYSCRLANSFAQFLGSWIFLPVG
jgi:hypothetical protein